MIKEFETKIAETMKQHPDGAPLHKLTWCWGSSRPTVALRIRFGKETAGKMRIA